MSNPSIFLKPIYKTKSFNGRFSMDSPKAWLDKPIPFILFDDFSKSQDYYRSSGESSFEDSFTLILPPIGKKTLKPIRKLNSFNKISIIPDTLIS